MLNKKSNRGFTIVELLIVIVVIAILAAISIVAYNGIQSRSKQSAAQSLASQIAKKAEAFNAVESSYPASNTTFGNGNGTTGNPAEAKLDDPGKVTAASGTTALTAPADEKTVAYKRCSPGAAIYWYDATTGKINTMGVGGYASVTTASNGTNPVPC